MSDGIKRDPEAKVWEDKWQDHGGVVYSFPGLPERAAKRVRVLLWPTAADGDGVTEPPTMDEVWPGRRMQTKYDGDVILTGAPPEWYSRGEGWEVTVRLAEGYGSDICLWSELYPITPTTRVNVETQDPEALRRLLGMEHKTVDVDDE